MKLLEKLLNAYGPSGNEEMVRKLIAKEIRPHVDELWVDKMGNLIAVETGIGPKIMVAAHMDEVGLMVKNIESDGKIRFSTVGFMDPFVLIGQKVHVQTKHRFHGVISLKELHESEDIKKVPEIEKLYVDTGLSKKELKRKGVQVGTYLIPEQKFFYLGNKDFIAGKAMDDRIGCYILIELAKKMRKSKQLIYYVFTVQEEMGLYGAKTSAFGIEPDWGIAVDTTIANDFSEGGNVRLGNGPAITIKDDEMIANKHINERLTNLAKKKKIPFQLEVIDIGTSDAMNISISRTGVPSTTIGIPIRNIHSTVSVANIKDIKHSITLLYDLLKKPINLRPI